MVSAPKKIFLILLFFIVLFFLFKLGVFDILFKFSRSILLNLSERGLKINKLFEPLFIKQNLLSENQNLKDKIFQLQSENINLRIQAEENKILRNQLKFQRRQRYNSVLVDIIGQGSEAGFNWYIVDRGTADGLKIGLAIIVEDGYLVGKIVKAEQNFAYFVPIFDNHFLTSVDFLAKDSINYSGVKMVTGLVQGKYGLGIEADFIPVEKNVNLGDYVITSGIEAEIPRGLIVGEVDNIEKKIDVPFQKAAIKPLISLKDLRIVSVLIP